MRLLRLRRGLTAAPPLHSLLFRDSLRLTDGLRAGVDAEEVRAAGDGGKDEDGGDDLGLEVAAGVVELIKLAHA